MLTPRPRRREEGLRDGGDYDRARYLMGLDDTDSRFGHCTTHLAYLIVCELERREFAFPRYPRLVRLNPNVPFKTRGNAAVCIEFEASSPSRRDEAFRAALRLMEEEADVKNGANPALLLVDASAPDLSLFREMYGRAVSGLLNYRHVLRAVSQIPARYALYATLGNGMGIVGAAASIGFDPCREDHTYELIAYREAHACGKPRSLDAGSVQRMESKTFPHTLNSFDHESRRILLAPKGPDPVLLGLRADSPMLALESLGEVRLGEEWLGYMVYATNQCTDAHVRSRLEVPLKAYSSGWLEGRVSSTEITQGGHMRINLDLGAGRSQECMLYEPAGDLRRMGNYLCSGDRLRISGGVRRSTSKHPTVLNVEKIEVLSLASSSSSSGALGRGPKNPRCADCGAALKSEGRGKGLRCKRCGKRTPRVVSLPTRAGRKLRVGIYLPSPRAQRHLTKQLQRYGLEATGGGHYSSSLPIQGWLAPPRIHRRQEKHNSVSTKVV